MSGCHAHTQHAQRSTARPAQHAQRAQHAQHATHLDARARRGAEPVAVWRERERVDDVAGVELVQALALGQVPQHRDAVLIIIVVWWCWPGSGGCVRVCCVGGEREGGERAARAARDERVERIGGREIVWMMRRVWTVAAALSPPAGGRCGRRWFRSRPLPPFGGRRCSRPIMRHAAATGSL